MSDPTDDDTNPGRGRTLLGHARADTVRAGASESDATRSTRGFRARDTRPILDNAPRLPSLRDTDERIATIRRDFADEPTPVREVRALDTRVDVLERHIVDIHGESGQNGKLGKLSDRTKLVLWVLGAAFTVAVGAIGTAVYAARSSGEEAGALKYEVQRNTEDLRDLRELIIERLLPTLKGVEP